MAHFTITSDDENSGATLIFDDGSVHTIGSDNPDYGKVIAGLVPTQTLTDEELLQIIAPFELIYKKLTKLSERVSRKGMKLYFDGDQAAHRLAQHILTIMDGGADDVEVQAWLKFWEKAATNPSLKSQDELFIFIEKHGLSITADGDAVLYKGVLANGTSMHAGPGIVDGVEYEYANLPNHVGAVVEIPRSNVDDNRGIACSKGLHVGDFTYPTQYLGSSAPRLLNVVVNPRDVVSVPFDENDRKIRVCRYVVASENPDKIKWEAAVVDPYEAPVDEDEETDEEIEEAFENGTPVQVSAAAPAKLTATPANGSRVKEYEDLIRSGGAGKNLKRFRNKRVTAGRRTEFDQAVANLGLTY